MSPRGLEPITAKDVPETGLEAQIREVLKPFAGQRDQVIPALQRIQERLGYVPEAAAREVSRLLGVSPNFVYGVVSFYGDLRAKPHGQHAVRVCTGPACHVRGALRLLRAVEGHLGVPVGGTTPDGQYFLETVSCLGTCANAPALAVDTEPVGLVAPEQVDQALARGRPETAPMHRGGRSEG
ncbi:MAG: NAD(P)H-dependent oxidoreductase subunit E [Chloroflexi bacterium]|nr:NAD(P)H-dependent oxidoreductase subunit E [Chloroflexota bacterium]